MKLTKNQINAIAAGQELSKHTDTPTLAVALANSIQGNDRISDAEAKVFVTSLTALFTALTEGLD